MVTVCVPLMLLAKVGGDSYVQLDDFGIRSTTKQNEPPRDIGKFQVEENAQGHSKRDPCCFANGNWHILGKCKQSFQ